MNIKYVILDECLPILLSPGHEHSVANRIGKPTSAGSCSFRQEVNRDPFSDSYRKSEWVVTCWGESLGLGIKSDPEWDASIIKRLLES